MTVAITPQTIASGKGKAQAVEVCGGHAAEHDEITLGEVDDAGRVIDNAEANGVDAVDCTEHNTVHQQHR